MSQQELFENRFDRAAAYVQEARKLGAEVIEAHKQLREKLNELDGKLTSLSGALSSEQLPELDRMLRMISNARYGLNQASIESSVGIHLGKALQEVWEKLP